MYALNEVKGMRLKMKNKRKIEKIDILLTISITTLIILILLAIFIYYKTNHTNNNYLDNNNSNNITNNNNTQNNNGNNNTQKDEENNIDNNNENDNKNENDDNKNNKDDNNVNNDNDKENNENNENKNDNNIDDKENDDNETSTPTITYTAYFKSNGATNLENEKIDCKVVDNKCIITIPNATRTNGTIIGYNTDKNAKTALYHVNQQINLTDNITLYVISSQKLNLQINSDNLDYISNNNTSCTIYNQETSCNVKLPFYNKKGYEVRGYSLESNDNIGKYYPNYNYTLKDKNTILYPIFNTTNHKKVITNINKTLTLGKMVIDVENGCSENIYNSFFDDLNDIINYAPFLAIGSKISFLSIQTYNSIWGNSYGITYGPAPLRSIDIRCPTSNPKYYTLILVHEMSHAWDYYYDNYFDGAIHEQSDIINLYDKYKNISNRPFRKTDSYKNVKEFFADMSAYYCLKYLLPNADNNFKNHNYPDDIKEVMEKYICLAKNNYNNNAC